MKYTEQNPPIVCMQTDSSCYKGTSTQSIKGILVHSTGTNNAYVKRYVQPSDDAENRQEMLELLGTNRYKNDYNHKAVEKGLNAFIGKMADGSVRAIQTLPWDYRPWGCGKGSKGSCNDEWLQFECCEDDLTNADYFNEVYKEIVELCAFLCKLHNLDPEGTATHKSGTQCPVITCHKEAHSIGLASNHGDPINWFSKYGKNMEILRADIAELLEEAPEEEMLNTEIFRIRKEAGDSESQIGAYRNLNNAIRVCNEAGEEYKVFDSAFEVVYPEPPMEIPPYYYVRKAWNDAQSEYGSYLEEEDAIAFCAEAGEGYKVFDEDGVVIYEYIAPNYYEPKVGERVTLSPDAIWANGNPIPSWIFNKKIYYRGKRNKDYVISTLQIGAISGVVHPQYISQYVEPEIIDTFKPYNVKILAKGLNVRSGPGTGYSVNTTIKENIFQTIVEESTGKGAKKWGKLKNGLGWISLDFVKKI